MSERSAVLISAMKHVQDARDSTHPAAAQAIATVAMAEALIAIADVLETPKARSKS